VLNPDYCVRQQILQTNVGEIVFDQKGRAATAGTLKQDPTENKYGVLCILDKFWVQVTNMIFISLDLMRLQTNSKSSKKST
jgi:hypothetical protein